MPHARPNAVSIYDRPTFEVEDGVRASVLVEANEDPSKLRGLECVTTQWECFTRGLTLSAENPMIGVRRPSRYKWWTYKQIYHRVCRFGSGMVKAGVVPGQCGHIGIMMGSCVEWNLTLLGGLLYSKVTVPLYATLGKDAVRFVIHQAELRTIVVDKADYAEMILSILDEEPSSVKMMIVVEEIPPELEELATKSKISLFQFSAVEKAGEYDALDRILPRPTDLACILYTSGTTGNPKGVMIEHKAIASNVVAAKQFLESTNVLAFSTSDVYFSYLPLAHSYEHFVQSTLMAYGCAIGYFSGDIKQLLTDARMLQPTKMAMVPRILNRLYATIMSKVKAAGGVREKLFYLGLKESTPDIVKQLIYADARKMFGGRLQNLMNGSAPLDPQIKFTISQVLGVDIVDGYGMTECYAAMACTLPGDKDPDGGFCPFPSAFLKLEDIPDMNYYAAEGKGEICYKGPGLMKGYYKEEEKTAEAIDEDGWLHTGDVGMLTEKGTYKIIDRKKAIFKLSQGEYIAPLKIENIYLELTYVSQLFIYGLSLKSHLVGLVFPDGEELFKTLGRGKYCEAEFERLCNSRVITNEILCRLWEIGKARGLKSFEQVKAIKLIPKLPTVENGLLSPTLKLKRNEVVERYKEDLDILYERDPV